MELLGAYSLDAVDADERRLVEAHLRSCPRCAAEVSDHREVAAMMAYSGAPAPEGVWTRIIETLEEPPPAMNLRVSPPDSAGPSAPMNDLSARRDRRQWIPLSAIAAALVVIALAFGVVANTDDNDPGRDELAASIEDVARNALDDHDSSTVLLESPGDETHRATAAIEPDGSGYLLEISLPALDESHTYQLWGIREDAVISLGVLGHAPEIAAFHVDDSIKSLAITAEVAGGVPQSSNRAVVAGDVV